MCVVAETTSHPLGLTMAIAVALAFGLDARFGEPRDAWHPVAWLGRLLAPLGRALRTWPAGAACFGGALAWCLLAAALAAAAWAVQSELSGWPVWAAAPLLALLLKPTFAWRMLRDEVAAVQAAQALGIDAARTRLARLVSRDVSSLDAAAVREATIETLAENLNDSLVAALFWCALFGLPGAVVYRFANTADAMWGYRGEWEWAGKWAARADDVLSWLPARVTALLLRPTLRRRDWQALRVLARCTPSPNGGWPMGAMALRLGVRLGKAGVYALNAGAPPPHSMHISMALKHATLAARWAVGAVVFTWLARSAWA